MLKIHVFKDTDRSRILQIWGHQWSWLEGHFVGIDTSNMEMIEIPKEEAALQTQKALTYLVTDKKQILFYMLPL